jgi:hypothetical protein
MEGHDGRRIVRQEEVGHFFVSTVFLGLDHSWLDDTPPALFETMVFHYDKNDHRLSADDAPQIRTPTWETALEAHAEAVVWARERLS